MRFKEGDKAIILFMGFEDVIILKVYDKTERYLIDQDNWKRYVKEHELYGSKKEYYDTAIKLAQQEVDKLKEEAQSYGYSFVENSEVNSLGDTHTQGKVGESYSDNSPESTNDPNREQDAPSDEVKDNWGNVVTGDEKEIKGHLDKNYPKEGEGQ